MSKTRLEANRAWLVYGRLARRHTTTPRAAVPSGSKVKTARSRQPHRPGSGSASSADSKKERAPDARFPDWGPLSSNRPHVENCGQGVSAVQGPRSTNGGRKLTGNRRPDRGGLRKRDARGKRVILVTRGGRHTITPRKRALVRRRANAWRKVSRGFQATLKRDPNERAVSVTMGNHVQWGTPNGTRNRPPPPQADAPWWKCLGKGNFARPRRNSSSRIARGISGY